MADLVDPKKTFDLLHQALDLAIEMFADGPRFSLVGYSVRTNGEMATHLITAKDDGEMFEKARKALALAPTARFAPIGEGQFGFRNALRHGFMAYIQDTSNEHVICMVRAYVKPPSENGPPVLENAWVTVRELPESWL